MAASPEGPGQPEWLRVGPDPAEGGRTGRHRSRLVACAAAILAAVLVGLSLADRTAPPAPQSSSTPSSPRAQESPRSATPQRKSIQEVGPLLPVRNNWELFARADAEVVRIQPATGRIVRTPVPSLDTSGPVTFVALRSGALIRPLDRVPGYHVPDDGLPRRLRSALGAGGPVLPGPGPDQLWVTSRSRYLDRVEMLLVSVESGATRAAAVLPRDVAYGVTADGSGYFLFQATGGSYLRVADGYRRVTSGEVLAAGRRTLLAAECDQRYRCRHLAIDRRTGARREVQLVPSLAVSLAAATVSPDGRYAAVLYRLATQPLTLHLIDLATGRDRTIRARPDARYGNDSLTWSPNGEYLLVTDADGRLTAVESATGRLTPLQLDLPPIHQLAVRPAIR